MLQPRRYPNTVQFPNEHPPPSIQHTTNTKFNRERGKTSKGEGPRKDWEKVQVLWICRGVGVVTSRVDRDEYRI